MKTVKEKQRYNDIIEVAARCVALSGKGKLPILVHELLAEAIDLRDVWRVSPDDLGDAQLPDRVLDVVTKRANALRREFAETLMRNARLTKRPFGS
jgi:hypothetical protein